MRKLISTLILALFLSITAFGGDTPIGGRGGDTPIGGRGGDTPIGGLTGDTPIGGYVGCAPGIYWVPSGICCMPNQECPVDGSGNFTEQTDKTGFVKTGWSMINIFLGLG